MIVTSCLLASLFGFGAFPWLEVTVVVLVWCFIIGLARATNADKQVLRHWSHLIDGFEYSPKEFYASLDEALLRRQMPGTRTRRKAVSQSGLLTGKRLYLRATRGTQCMDICAAPFGYGVFDCADCHPMQGS